MLLAETLEEKNIYALESLKLLYEESRKILLIPKDLYTETLVLTKQFELNEKFRNRRQNLKKNITIEELIDFYIDALDLNQEKSYISTMQILLRIIYEHNLLSYLKRDLEKNKFLFEEKRELLKTTEGLLFLDNSKIYEEIEAQNKFYANNIKKYIDLEMKNPIDKYLIFDANSYKEFLFYLDKGKKILFKAIEQNDFHLYDKFLKDEMHVSKEEISKLRKSLKDENVDELITLSTAHWIKMQIFIRYRTASYPNLINMIKKEKEFFKSMYRETLKEIL